MSILASMSVTNQLPFGFESSETARRMRELSAGSPKKVSVCSSVTSTNRSSYWS